MSAPLRLYSTVSGNAKLWSAEERARANTRTITVDRAALKALLMDHAALLNALTDRRVTVTTPED